jgi:hypothetical protein
MSVQFKGKGYKGRKKTSESQKITQIVLDLLQKKVYEPTDRVADIILHEDIVPFELVPQTKRRAIAEALKQFIGKYTCVCAIPVDCRLTSSFSFSRFFRGK